MNQKPLQPPVYCLMATVKEAKGILGKDISGEWFIKQPITPTALVLSLRFMFWWMWMCGNPPRMVEARPVQSYGTPPEMSACITLDALASVQEQNYATTTGNIYQL